MKIAIFASQGGEKALYLHDFFKEGNRITVEILYTDDPNSPVADRIKAEGIEVDGVTPEENGSELAENLRKRGVELLVVDGYQGYFPEELKEAYGNAIVYPTSPQSAPLEVIEAIDKLNAHTYNQVKDQHAEQQASSDRQNNPEQHHTDIEKEWADALDINLDAEQENNTQEPQQSTDTQPSQQPQAQQPLHPQGQPAPQNPMQRNAYPQAANGEPMPDTYLVWSVIITILCCLIPGVIAIIYSASVSSKYYRGDIEGAKRASRNAQIWCIVSIVTGIIWSTLYLPLTLLGS